MTFQIDTGSTANILPLQDYIREANDVSKASIVPVDIILIIHDQSKRNALGFTLLKVELNGRKHVNQNVTPLLGLKSSQGMGLVKTMVSDVYAPVNHVAAHLSKKYLRMS